MCVCLYQYCTNHRWCWQAFRNHSNSSLNCSLNCSPSCSFFFSPNPQCCMLSLACRLIHSWRIAMRTLCRHVSMPQLLPTLAWRIPENMFKNLTSHEFPKPFIGIYPARFQKLERVCLFQHTRNPKIYESLQ